MKAQRAAAWVTASAIAAACGGTVGNGDAGPPSGEGIASVPRNRTLIVDCADTQSCTGQIQDYDSFNPYLPAFTSRTGSNFLYEPLYYYNAFRESDNLIPWIAVGHEYNDDFTEVTVRIRDGVEWSDGTPWTAADLVFTIDMLRTNAPMLSYSTDMATWVAEAEVVDAHTARISLRAPNPRFMFTYFTYNFGIGIPIVPRHIWEGRDPETFRNLDQAKGWPVVTGPYQLAFSVPEQRVWDLRADWWAAKVGFSALPKVERLIYLPYMDETKRVQNLIANEMDSSLDLRPPNIQVTLAQNEQVTTWTGRDPPFGYLDFWPVSLGFNNLEEPFSDPEIRWAINHAINRPQLVAVGWQGSGNYSLLPFPDFPPMRRFTDSLDKLLEKYPVGVHDPALTARIMARKGWRREGEGEGYWTKAGERLKIVFDITDIFQDLAPVLAAQLKRAGFDAAFRMTSDTYTRVTQGKALAYLNGHGASVRDPHYTLSLYHSRHVRPTGTAAEYYWRWSNAEFDQIVDRMGQVATDDPQLQELFDRAMEIWLRELPSIPLVQWYHRIPHNETYWENWPTAENPYINSAYWHRTWLLVLLNLKPVQS